MVTTYFLSRGVRLEWDPATGAAHTRYADGTYSGCACVPEDREHGDALGISPERHRLMHELAHHLVGLAYYKHPHGSPVIWRDAHGESNDVRDAELEEWMVTALCYLAMNQRVQDYGAILDLSQRCDVANLVQWLTWLAEAPPGVGIVVGGWSVKQEG